MKIWKHSLGLLAAAAVTLLASMSQAAEDYRIVSDTAYQVIKRTVEVELPTPVSEARLGEIAREIKGRDRRPFQRTFIGYRLKGEAPGLPYWATTHYNPNLNVQLLGHLRP